jgi:short-subunit dehydrogenase
MKTFKGKTAYVIGGSSGIGLAVSEMLAREKARVIIFSRKQVRLNTAVDEIKKKIKNGAVFVSSMLVDATDILQVNKVMNKALSEFGPPDLLINCAGRAMPGYFENILNFQMQETFKINFFGTWNVISALLPEMKKRGGTIVNVSSIGGYIGLFGYTDYCASKFAIIGFSEALKSELERYGIRISVLCPPDTDTPGFQNENLKKPEETKIISGNIKPFRPEYIARELLSGIKKNKFLILPGIKVKLSYLIKRLAPSLMDYIIHKSLKKKDK